MAARSSALVVGLLGAGAAAGLFVASEVETPGKGPSDSELAAIAAEIDSQLREASAYVESRAQTISDLPRLNAAVATDEGTFKDMLQKELGFRVKVGETIEIGQVFKDGHEQVLFRLPDGVKMAIPLAKEGQRLMTHKGKVMVAQVVSIAPSDHADELTGAVAVSQELALGALVDRLDKLGTAAYFEIDGDPVLRGTRAPVVGATTRDANLTTPLGKELKVVAEVLPAESSRSVGLLVAAVVALLAGLAGAVVLWRRKPAPAPTGTTDVVGGLGALPAPGSGPSITPTQAAQLGQARTEFPAGNVAGVGEGSPRASPSSAMRIPGGMPTVGGRFGRYTLLKQLGAGGMAEVYLASISGEAGFEKQVALKIMHANLSTQEKVVDLFLDEARIVSRLTHPNIVQISDLGKDGTDYFIAMEYVDGWDLDKLVRQARLAGQQVPLRVGLTILRKVCDGLNAAHAAVDPDGRPLELVHRDVKAENVLLSRTGAVKVGDFGIAKANQQVHKTQLGELKGTAAYMAPEHRTGQAVDRRADIYGVGAIAYEVLTGNEVNLDLAMLAHLGREGWPHLPAPTKVRPDLPPELDAIVFKALAYEKDARYASCEEFEEALEAVGVRHGLTASDKVVGQWVESAISGVPLTRAASSSPAAGGAA